MNAVTATAPAALNYADLERLAASIAQSGLFGIKTKDQAIALMMIAHAEGRHPALAARDYDVIQGKPAKKSEAMMRDFIQAGGKCEWHALTDELADATFTHPQTGSVRIDWDMERAKMAGFAGKDNWKKFPRAMLRARVVSEGVRTVWPLATSGLYVPEEVTDFNGPTIDAEPPTDARAALNATIPLRSAAAATPRAPRKVDPAVYAAEPAPAYPGAPPNERPERTEAAWRIFLDKLRAAVAVLHHRDEVIEIGGRATVGDALAAGPEWVQREISSILAEAYARFPAEPGDDLDEVVIEGEERLAAG